MTRFRAKICVRVKMEPDQELKDRDENVLVPSSLQCRQGTEEQGSML